jgi:two-component sensor histidine kinase
MMAREHQKRIQAEVALREALEVRSNEELQKHIETQNLLIGELNHRVKNTLASVQAMARMSFKNVGPESRSSLDAFQARLLALSTAHNLLNESNWSGASLADLVRTELTFGADMRKVTMEGPEVELTARETVSLALVIHELATNSMKYGSLRPEVAGRLVISWDVEGSHLQFRWEAHLENETIAPPTRSGFGLRMIRQAIERELEGELHTDWQPDGLKLSFRVPLEKLQPSPVSHADAD